MSLRLRNQTILITGAAGGLGSALARACLEAGAVVILLDKNQRALEKLADQFEVQSGDNVSLVPMDLALAGPEDFHEVVDQIEKQFGGLDALIHCAAFFEGLKLLEQIQPHEWLEQIQVNLNAPWLLSNACLPLLRQSVQGHLVFMLADLSGVAKVYHGAYGVSKRALHELAGMFSQECPDVNVLAINPGPMRTALRQSTHYAENPELLPHPDEKAIQIINLLNEDEPREDIYIDF